MPPQIAQLLPLIVLFGFFWFFILRPQQQQQKKRQAMLDSLQKGDQVVTIGGIHGQVVDLTPETARLRIAANVEITVSRGAIGSVRKEQAEAN